MAFKATVLGREELTRRLERLTPGVAAAAAEAKLIAAREAANRIAAAAPVRTGTYKDSIIGAKQADMPGKTSIGQQSKDPDATGVYAEFVWKFLEFGTAPHNIGNGMHPGSRAQPHVFPTWKAYRKTAKALINKAINKAVKDSLKK